MYYPTLFLQSIILKTSILSELFSWEGFGSGIIVELIGATLEVLLILRLLNYLLKKKEDKKYLTARIALLSQQIRLIKTFKTVYAQHIHLLDKRAHELQLKNENEMTNEQCNYLFEEPYAQYNREFQDIRDTSLSEFVNAAPILDELSIKHCSRLLDNLNRASKFIYDIIFYDNKRMTDGKMQRVTFGELFLEMQNTIDSLEGLQGLFINHQIKLNGGMKSNTGLFVKKWMKRYDKDQELEKVRKHNNV